MESTEVVKITSNQSSSCDSVSREKRNHILSYTFQNILKIQTLFINSYPKKKWKYLNPVKYLGFLIFLCFILFKNDSISFQSMSCSLECQIYSHFLFYSLNFVRKVLFPSGSAYVVSYLKEIFINRVSRRLCFFNSDFNYLSLYLISI